MATEPSTKSNNLRFGYLQYTPQLVSYWDSLIDWDKRREGEGKFFIDQLKAHDVHTVLDFACGTGYDTIRLLQEGFNVTSSDGSQFMLTKARINAEDREVSIDARFCDWSRLSRNFHQTFDAAICLGNSLCHLFDHDERVKVLKQVAGLLRPGGVLIVDQRNFDAILDEGLQPSHDYVYCGDNAEVEMQEISDKRVHMHYIVEGHTFDLDLFPLRREQLVSELVEAGFDVTTHGDYKKDFSPDEANFLQHVCVRKSQ